MAFEPKNLYSLEDYFELERNSDEKFEYRGGTVWSMAGASDEHNQITMNLSVEIGGRLKGTNCRAYPSDMRVKVPAFPPYRYPDLSAVCGERKIESVGGIDMLVNPQLIVEVLSDSTEGFDRGDKFGYYKSIESFSEYLLVAQHRPHVTQFYKQGDIWVNAEANSLDETIELRSIPVTLQLSAVYSDVVFKKLPLRPLP